MTNVMSITYGGVELNDLIGVESYDTQILPSTTQSTVDVGQTPGQTLLSNKWGIRTITISCYLFDKNKRNELSGRIASLVPKPLIFGDDPDKVYNCIPQGANALAKTPTDDLTAFTLTFIAYDPFIYAKDPVTFTNKQADGTYSTQLTVNNTGTADVPVNIDAKMNSENGYFAATVDGEDTGVIIGDIEGQVTAKGEKGTVDINTDFESASSVNNVTQNKYPSNYFPTSSLNGAWKAGVKVGGNGSIVPSSYGEPSNAATTGIYGSSWFAPLKAPSAHMLAYTPLRLSASTVRAMGYVEITLVDENGAGICGYRFRKINASNKNIELYLWVGDDTINSWSDAQGTSWIINNFVGEIRIEKNGADVVFRFKNNTHKAPWARTVHYPDIEDTKVAGVNVYAGKFGKRKELTTGFTYLQLIRYTTKWSNTSNLWQLGDTVSIDSSSSVPYTYTNGVPTLDVQSASSAPLIIPASSEGNINLDVSTDAATPEVTATITPRFL